MVAEWSPLQYVLLFDWSLLLIKSLYIVLNYLCQCQLLIMNFSSFKMLIGNILTLIWLSFVQATLSSLLNTHAPLINKFSRHQSPSNPWFIPAIYAFRSTLSHADDLC